MLRPDELAEMLRVQGLGIVSVAAHRHAADVLIIYLSGPDSRWMSDVAAMTVADVPGVKAVTATVNSRSMLLVQLEPTAGAGEDREGVISRATGPRAPSTTTYTHE